MSDQQVPGVGSPGSVPDNDMRFSTFDPSDQRLQIINDSKQFSPIVSEYMKKHWHLADKGFNYNVVAVFGSQSTGKSTLLNRLFGTNFDVMNESTGRQQTTKGIWVSKADDSNTVVLDVEGTDGGERFEDQDFERKSALFSLAISEVVIVNMYENNVGLYNGANLGLLKTVLDVNLQLFQQKGSPKTCLYFVIRDFTSQTPLAKLSETLMNYLEKIWAGLSKPESQKDSQIHDFFTFAFMGLPHKIFAREAFETAVGQLRTKFTDPKGSEYVFLPELHKRVPADGFSSFAEGIWERIASSKELDLPTQTQLLAEHRCEEISREVFEEMFVPGVRGLKAVEKGKVLAEFGEVVNSVTGECMAKFDVAGSRYNTEVYHRKRLEFFNKMATHLQSLYNQQLANIAKECLKTFSSSLAAGLADDESKGVSLFAKHMAEALKESEDAFLSGAEAAKLKDAQDWSPETQFAHFMVDIERTSGEKRAEAVTKMVTVVEKLIVGAMKDTVVAKLNAGGGLMWVGILDAFKEAVEFGTDQVQKRGQGFEASKEEATKWKAALQWQTWVGLLDTLKIETTDDAMLARLKVISFFALLLLELTHPFFGVLQTIFESKFRYDEQGVPRLWNLEDPIDMYYSAACDEADRALTGYAKIGGSLQAIGSEIIDDQRFDPSCVTIIPSARLQTIRDRFKRESDVLFVEAKRSMVLTTAKIPPWFIAMTIVLGWNEFMMVLFNPVYFTLLAITLGGLYIAWQYGMIGPAYQIARVTVREVVNQAVGELEKGGIEVPEFVKQVGRGGEVGKERRPTTKKVAEEQVVEEIEMEERD
ncbi:Dynamin-like GTPase that mediates homotypic ER fusion [Podochytrium sp. JEL0797]|nr:Dynamin-like GTPase that mediates homotypic ER fusion [Podochytrium sp. JEL0797]